MLQYIFFVKGVRDDVDRTRILECAREIFATSEVTFSMLTSSLTVDLPKTDDLDELIVAFQKRMEEFGYDLKLPPNCVEIDETSVPVMQANEFGQHLSKHPRRVPLWTLISSVCVVLVLAILATYAVASRIFDQRLVDLRDSIWDQNDEGPGNAGGTTDPAFTPSFPELELLQFLFDQYAIQDIDQEKLMDAVLKAYAQGTGDEYAAYYTDNEWEELQSTDQGEMEGIGVSVVNDTVEINGFTYSVLNVISVFKDSPALEADVRVGDYIYTVVDGDGETFTVDALGYDKAIACVRGVAGTKAKFTVLRFGQGEDYEVVPFEIERRQVTTESVSGYVLQENPDIGLVEISQFDLTTPPQFKATMDDLIAKGCTQFIFDVRYNPGGALQSVEAVLSTLLEKNDVMIKTVYNDGSQEVDRVQVIRYSMDGYDTCDVTAEDIGKYRGYEYVVLTNQYTASAAELFASNLRDHGIATLVGDITFGKGCMQSIFDLSYFGVDGAVKMTTAWYQPPSGENYHGVGITPDVEVQMDEQLLEKYKNIYLIPDLEDTQIVAAIEAFNNK